MGVKEEVGVWGGMGVRAGCLVRGRRTKLVSLANPRIPSFWAISSKDSSQQPIIAELNVRVSYYVVIRRQLGYFDVPGSDAGHWQHSTSVIGH